MLILELKFVVGGVPPKREYAYDGADLGVLVITPLFGCPLKI
jgi:hypothetical protein